MVSNLFKVFLFDDAKRGKIKHCHSEGELCWYIVLSWSVCLPSSKRGKLLGIWIPKMCFDDYKQTLKSNEFSKCFRKQVKELSPTRKGAGIVSDRES